MSISKPDNSLGGSEVKFFPGLDFRYKREKFSLLFPDATDLLLNGLKIGCRARLHWQQPPVRRWDDISGTSWNDEERPKTKSIYLEAQFSGEFKQTAIPISIWHPQKEKILLPLPVFDLSVGNVGVPPKPIGEATIAYLAEGNSAGIYEFDGNRINASRICARLGIQNYGLIESHLGVVQDNSLHAFIPSGVV